MLDEYLPFTTDTRNLTPETSILTPDYWIIFFFTVYRSQDGYLIMFKDQKEKNHYIDKVWEKLEARYLKVFPFLTDGEFRELFGDKTIQILENLDCPNEGCGQCDFEIDCPYYSQMLDRCGIDPYKPVHCRLWHCYDCGPEPLIKQIRELTGIFSDQLGPEAEARRIKDGLEGQRISKDEAERRFLQLIEEFRNISPDSS